MTAADAANANTTILTTLGKNVDRRARCSPAEATASTPSMRRSERMLDDARAHAATLIAADAAAGGCRNTIVVLVVGGGEGTITPQDLAAKASTFLNVGGRRVPVYVVAIAPPAADVAALQAVAANSGGQYFEITEAMINATTAGSPVPLVTRAVNTAVQHTFVTSTTFNTAPTAASAVRTLWRKSGDEPHRRHRQPARCEQARLRPALEVLPDSETFINNGGVEIPQRSNVMVTTGFALPGFEARLRAFRVYKPVPDPTKPSGLSILEGRLAPVGRLGAASQLAQHLHRTAR